ncbi:MAG TPA: o-succinylbenzoate synthase, partial [Candidatus Nanopelagicales bacterium]|nr:o-succinylbenzoate synthase [Candidatus Nanopelagicales bacterium]
ARRFRGTELREGVLLRVGTTWGEWAPFPEYDDVTAARWLRGALEAARDEWPRPHRDNVAVNAIVPALGPDAVRDLVATAVADDGCSVVKVKVAERGQDFADDVARVAAVRSALDDAGAADGVIRVDANGAWSVDEAVERLDVLDSIAGGLEYAEQPCASLAELAAVRARSGVRIAVDEGVRLAASHDAALAQQVREGADVLVLKATPLGGVAAALAVAEEIGLPVTVSGAMDSSIGLAAGLALAAALPAEPLACGFGTGRLLAADLVGATTLPRDGRLSAVRPDPDPDALRAAADRVPAERALWWRDRLSRCLAILGEGP